MKMSPLSDDTAHTQYRIMSPLSDDTAHTQYRIMSPLSDDIAHTQHRIRIVIQTAENKLANIRRKSFFCTKLCNGKCMFIYRSYTS